MLREKKIKKRETKSSTMNNYKMEQKTLGIFPENKQRCHTIRQR